MAAPLVLFAYNRPEHLSYTLTALQNNKLASKTPLFIYSDGAKGEHDAEAVAAVREVCKNTTGFASVKVIESPANKGLANSVIAGVSEQMTAHGQVIVVEDDLITSPNFLLYMNSALQHYKDDPKVFSIGGYQFPEHSFAMPQGYAWDTYVNYRGCSWGWASWSDRWDTVDWTMSYFPAMAQDKQAIKRFEAGGPDHFKMLQKQYEGKIDSWAIRFNHGHYAADQYCVYPVKSLVMNIGLDGSGVHCGTEGSKRRHLELDPNWLPKNFCPGKSMNAAIAKKFYDMFR